MLELLRHGHGVESWTPIGEVAHLFFGGNDILVAVEHDVDEVERRRQRHLAPITNRKTLQLLLSLPHGVAIPVAFLREEDLLTLQAMPAGVVDLDDSEVRVVAAPALQLSSVGVTTATWKQGLRLTSPYASYCARYVILEREQSPEETAVAALEARFYGIGLAEHRDSCLDWVVSPAPFGADRFSAASWLMAERLTAALQGHAQ